MERDAQQQFSCHAQPPPKPDSIAEAQSLVGIGYLRQSDRADWGNFLF